jgi:hypothetical protein
MDDASPSGLTRDGFDRDKLDLFTEYYRYRKFDPNDIMLDLIEANGTKNEFVEKKNSVHINVSLDNEYIRYIFIKMNGKKPLENENLANELNFAIYPRKLEIKPKHITRLYNLGSDLELKEFCFFERNFSVFLIKDGKIEFPIHVSYIWSWFNIIFSKERKFGRGERKLNLLMYKKLITSNSRLNLLLGGGI